MNLFEALAATEERTAPAGRIYGMAVGVVTNNQDPDGMARVKVKFPWLSSQDESQWARIACPPGLYLLPEVDNEVLVAFEHGDMRFPYVLGVLSNGKDAPPTTNDDGKNNIRVLKSRSGHVIRLTDEDGKEKIEIIDKSEKNSIVFDTAENVITITSEKDIVLSATKGMIKLDAKTIEISSSDPAKIESQKDMDVKAGGTLNVKGSTVNIN